MRILLFVLGLLALASGGLKFRDRVMNKIGTSPLAMVEVGLGLLACVSSIFLDDGVVVQSIIAALTLGAVFLGSYHQAKLTAAFRHRRELSESHRLKRFVESEPPAPKAPRRPGTEGEQHGA